MVKNCLFPVAFANKVLTYVIVIFDINKAEFLASFAVHLYEIYMLLVCALSSKCMKKSITLTKTMRSVIIKSAIINKIRFNCR